jgi:oligopeptide/dipeptide ABC transporter ATP-binding protein
MPAPPLLEVRGLRIEFPGPRGPVAVVRDLSFRLDAGESVGLVGESGSGKSLTALALLRLLPGAARVNGEILLDGVNLMGLAERELCRVRGGRIGLVFQEPMTALNPSLRVGDQVAETVRAHSRLSAGEARAEAVGLLEKVGLPSPARRYADYPHQLSGGQRQRVLIAAALAGRPALLIADEPTTALDVTLQAQILDLLRTLRDTLGLAVLLITHDFGVAAALCQRLLVLYAGALVEDAAIAAALAAPAHPYTAALLRSVPRLGSPAPRGRMPGIPGTVPDPSALPGGCAFHPRCVARFAPCDRERPPLATAPHGGLAACWLHAPGER